MAVEATDPLLRSAEIALASGLYTKEALLAKYEAIRAKCFAAADEADRRPKLVTLEEVVAPLAPTRRTRSPRKPCAGITPQREKVFGGAERLPEKQAPRHLAIQINNALHDLFCGIPRLCCSARTWRRRAACTRSPARGCSREFQRAPRVQHPARRDVMILGPSPRLRQHGHAAAAGNPVPGLLPQRLRPDPRRGLLRCSFLQRPVQQSDGDAHRLAGYQRGFGGHFHNDNSITALRDIPSLVVGCPSRGDDAATMLRTLTALAKVDGRVCAFSNPSPCTMTRTCTRRATASGSPATRRRTRPCPGRGRVTSPRRATS